MRKSKLFIAILRIAIGWIFLYWGIVAFNTPGWTIAPALQNAGTFSSFYNLILEPANILYVSSVVKVLYFGVGVLLILGVGARLASLVGLLLMLFLYFPSLHFPYVGSSYYIVDEHLIMALILAHLFMIRSGEYFGLGNLFHLSRY